jgi:two-component system, OmpR family, alkaline phosphatase synthesis response regulator PhoP
MPSQDTQPLVLTVDPDADCSALMARQLEWAGYGVLSTGDPAEALALVEERRPDALIVEATLPGTSGYALIRELRAQPHNRLMPIVMVSDRAARLDGDSAFTSSADAHILKPFRCADVVARLAFLAPAAPSSAGRSVHGGRRKRGRRVAQPALALR